METKLKFRVWDKLTKQHTYPDKGYQGHFMLTLNGEFHNFQNGVGGNEVIVEQWTGLTDKTGRDIYVGDVIEIHSETYNCDVTHEVSFAFGIFGVIFDEGELPMPLLGSEKKMKVIGNIHETDQKIEP